MNENTTENTTENEENINEYFNICYNEEMMIDQVDLMEISIK